MEPTKHKPPMPTRRELKQFGLIMMAFFALLAALAGWRHHALLRMAPILAACWLISLAFQREDRKGHGWGFLLPCLLGAAGLLVPSGLSSAAAAGVVFGVGAILGLVVIASENFGRGIFRGWTQAAQPIGWTISALILAFVYYIVLTPIGLLMRIVGRDTMHRELDPAAQTYWIKRSTHAESARYFRQF